MRTPWLGPLRRDLRFAIRVLVRKRVLGALVVATLAFGIGVNAAVFAVVYEILVRPLPYAEASRIVVLDLRLADGGSVGFSPRTLGEWLERLRTVDAAAGYHTREVTVRAGADSSVIPAAFVTSRFFEVLGTPAVVGRAPARLDQPEVVVSERAAGQVPARPPDPVLVGGSLFPIAGIMPAAFAFPNEDIALWIPSTTSMPGYARIVARLKPGVTVDQVRDDANRVRLELDGESTNVASVVPLGESVIGRLRAVLLTALAGALLVFGVACANVATLFIGRDVARRREFATRLALGEGRGALARGVLIEAALVASIASLVGVGLAVAAIRLFAAEAMGAIPGLDRMAMDLPIAIGVPALTVVATLLCGASSAWHAMQVDIASDLRPTAASRPGASRVRAALVIAQIACCTVLLVGAGLVTRTVSAITKEEAGFNAKGALGAKVVLSDEYLMTDAVRGAFVPTLLGRIRALPGVQHAGFGTSLPPRSPLVTASVDFVADGIHQTRLLSVTWATPGYLRALGARFLNGRDFEPADVEKATVILSESAARAYFPGQDAVGRSWLDLPSIFGAGANPRVIAVVGDVKSSGLDAPVSGGIYLPWGRRPMGRGYLVVRAAGDASPLAAAIRRAAQDIDPTVPIQEIQPLDVTVAQSIAGRRVQVLPAVGFGLLALVVALVGLLGALLAHIAERRPDLAVRAAFGASPRQLVLRIMAQGLALTLSGMAVGFALAALTVQAMSPLLYQIPPYDLVTFAGTALLIGGVAILITFLAAVQAGRTDPLLLMVNE